MKSRHMSSKLRQKNSTVLILLSGFFLEISGIFHIHFFLNAKKQLGIDQCFGSVSFYTPGSGIIKNQPKIIEKYHITSYNIHIHIKIVLKIFYRLN